MINVILKMNQVTIQNANLLFAMNEFFEKFVDCVIASLIDLFFDYDQLFFVEKCKNMIIFIISFDLIKMTTIFIKMINSVIQFVCVVNKIIVNYVSHYAFFLLTKKKFKICDLVILFFFLFFFLSSFFFTIM